MLTFLETLHLIRAGNCLLAMAGVWIGASETWFTPTYYAPLVASLAAFFICGAGNVVNDLVDTEIDRVNHPRRVLVRGALSRKYARNLAVVFNIIGIVLAVALSVPVALVALVVIVLLLAYNLRLKRIPGVGNLAVALLAGMTFLTGGLAVDHSLAFRLPGPMIPAAFAVLFHLVREILKDVQDIEGDRRAGIKSLPLVAGVSVSLLIGLVLFVLLAVLICLPVYFDWYGRIYEVIAVYVVALPLLALLIFVWGKPNPMMLRIGSTALKIGMGLGLVALLLA